VENDQLVLPWVAANQPETPIFKEVAEYLRAGETAEFIKKDYPAAEVAYRVAMASARRPRESAEARLLLARALSKAGNTEEASRQYRVLLDAPAEAKDEQGVGLRFYARSAC
jgi:thioredoxin-like negative regulator of GroEL